MSYLDVVVIPVSADRLDEYKKLSRKISKMWVSHGAVSYVDTLADDVPEGKTTDFYRSVKLKPGEVLGLGVATYKTRAHRDKVVKKVMADPMMSGPPGGMPFDGKRMIFGGFESIVEA